MDIFTFTSGGVINLHKAEITAADGSKHALGHKENELLRLLLRHTPEVVNKHVIVEEVWQRPSVSESAVSVAIAKLRKLLRTISDSDVEIITAKGVGYRIALSADVVVGSSDQVRIASSSAPNEARSVQERLISETELLTEEEKSCLMEEMQSFSAQTADDDHTLPDSSLDVTPTQRAAVRPSWLTPMFITTFFSLFVLISGYLYWAYQFTECKTITSDETSNQVQVCWSELSERVAMKQVLTQNLKGVGIVLVDKNKDIKLYSVTGERLVNE